MLRRHQERLIEKSMRNFQRSVIGAVNTETNKVDTEKCEQTKIIAPWCSNSGKSHVLEQIAERIAGMGFRILFYSANSDNMRSSYENIKNRINGAWELKDSSKDEILVTNAGGIIYIVSNRDNIETITSVRPYVDIVLVDDGDYVVSSAIRDVLNIVATSIIIGTRHGSSEGLLSHLMDNSTPHDGVTIMELSEDDLMAEGYGTSLNNTSKLIQERRNRMLEEADKLSQRRTNIVRPNQVDPDETGTRPKQTELSSEREDIIHDQPSATGNQVE